jgi:serine/threonine/tyrosine-interacting protein
MPEGCHEIVPGLWLGSRRAVSLANFQELNIQVVITVMDPEDIADHGIDVVMDDACEDLKVSWIQIECQDNPDENIHAYFKDVSDVLEQCVVGGKRVLIHCLGGVSRSPTLVCAYLMKSCSLGWKEALTFVQGKRSCVNPNIGFLAQLEEWGKECSKECQKECEKKNKDIILIQ